MAAPARLKIPEFSNEPSEKGKKKQDYQQWVTRFRSAVRLNAYTPEQVIGAAQYALIGEAADLAECLSFELGAYAGADDEGRLNNFFVALKELFQTPARAQIARTIMETRVQREDEDIHVFHSRLHRLWKDGWADTEEAWRNAAVPVPQDPYDNLAQRPGSRSRRLIEKFIAGVRQEDIRLEIRRYITSGHDVTEYPEVLTLAVAFQSDKDRNAVDQRRITSGYHPKSYDDYINPPRRARQARQGDAGEPMDVGNLDLAAVNGGKWCTFHRTDQHEDRECRAQRSSGADTGSRGRPNNPSARKPGEGRSFPPSGSGASQKSSGGPGGMRGGKINRTTAKCGRCGGTGHFRRECPSAPGTLPALNQGRSQTGAGGNSRPPRRVNNLEDGEEDEVEQEHLDVDSDAEEEGGTWTEEGTYEEALSDQENY